MEEIKAPMTDRIKRFIGNHIAIIGLVLFCVVLFFSSCGRAKAAEPISPYEIQYLEDMMQSWDTFPNNTPVDFTSLYAQFESDCNNYPYYVTNNSNYIIMCKKPSFGLVSLYGSSYSPLGAAFNVSEYPNWQDSFPFIIYQSYSPASDWRVVIRFVVSDFSGGMTVSPMRFSWTGNMVSSKTDYTRITYYNSNSFSVSNTSWYGNADSFYRCNGSQGTGYSTGWSVSQESVTPIQIPYTEDSRLKFSTSLRGDGEKLLNTDLSDFLHWNDEGDTQSVYNVSLTLDCDGTEVVIPLDSNNSEVVFTRNMFNYTYRCVYITPFSELGLDEYDDVTIVKCDFNRVTVNPNAIGFDEEFKIACNYVLKYETAPIESEEIEYNDDVQGDKLTQQDMDDVYYNIHFNDDADLDFDEFFDVEFPDGFSFYYVCLKNVASSWSDMIEDGFITPSDIYYLVTQTIPTKAALEEYIASWIKDNQAALFYDVVVFDYVQETNTTLTHTYYYYTTESGRIRAISNLLADIYQESNQISVNTAGIYDYLYSRLNDFEDKSLESFNDMVSLDRQRNSWLGTISSGVNTLNQTSLNGFADVVEAINDIDIPVPTPFDDDDILDVLGDILDALGSIINNQNSTQDGFTPLIAWVKDDENVNGIYTWVNNMMRNNILADVFKVFSLADLEPSMTGDQTYLFFSTNFFKFATGTDSFDYFDRMFDSNINFDDWNGGYTGWDSGG